MSHPLALLRRMTADSETRRCEVELLDDTAAGEDLRDYDLPGVLRNTYYAQDAALTLVLQGVGEIVAEVGGRLGRAEPLEGRAVASSTKAIWITLARHVHSPVKLPRGERGPAAMPLR